MQREMMKNVRERFDINEIEVHSTKAKLNEKEREYMKLESVVNDY